MILPSFSATCHLPYYGVRWLAEGWPGPVVMFKGWAVTVILFCFIGIPPRAHSRDSSDSADGRATPSENLVPSSARVDKPPSVLPYFNRPPSALPLMGLPPPPIPPPPPLSSSFGVLLLLLASTTSISCPLLLDYLLIWLYLPLGPSHLPFTSIQPSSPHQMPQWGLHQILTWRPRHPITTMAGKDYLVPFRSEPGIVG